MNTVLEWPHEWYQFVSSEFSLRTFALGSQAVFTPRRNMRLVYQVWTAQYVVKPEIGPSKWQGKSAFFSRLDGEAGLMRIGDPLRCVPAFNRRNFPNQTWSDGTLFTDGTGWINGAVPANAVVKTAAERGAESIIIKGLQVSTANVLAAGDLFELRINGVPSDTSNLYEIVVGGGTNAAGEMGIEFRPRLRMNIAADDMVVLYHPRGVFQLADGNQGRYSRSANQGAVGFQVIEYVG